MVNLRQNYNFSKKQKLALCLMVLTGLSVSILANAFYQASAPVPVATASDISSPSTVPEPAGPSFSGIHSSLAEIDDNESEDSFQPAPDKLNLIYFYGADADTSDVLNSYAGKIYQKLMSQDSQYIAGIYDLAGVSPREMCRQLGISTSRVLGKYNPNASSQDASDSSTWYVPNFKNVNFSFYNADGQRVSEYSNVKDIMAMASVYCYYHNYLDYETYEKICLELYQKSRSYRVSIGNVYYDNGCIHKSAKEEEEDEAAYEEQQAQSEEQELSLGGSNAGINLAEAEIVENQSGEYTIKDSSGNELHVTTIDGKQYVISYTEEDAKGRRSVRFTPIEEYAGGALSSSGTESSTEETEETQDYGTEIPLTGSTAANESVTAESSAAESTAAPETASAAETTAPSTQSQSGDSSDDMLVFSQMSYRSSGRGGVITTLAGGTGGGVKTVASNNFVVYDEDDVQQESSASADTGSSEGVAGESKAEKKSTEKSSAGSDDPSSKNYCPGHVDLNISVTIYGFEDNNGLRALNISADDTLEAADAASANPLWQGWTEENINSVNTLIAQDWFKTYGLSISTLDPKAPLTEEEISAYLDKLPSDISEERKTLVRYALSSVGKIPYYYGGKASCKGFEGNGFGLVTGEADYKGRILRGLDCSGWIQWVYWSALGDNLDGAASTANLIGCGEKIRRADLKPGDIVVRPGTDSHVVMFLCWADNGNMIAIHENSSANNVSVNEVTANYPYYRRLIK